MKPNKATIYDGLKGVGENAVGRFCAKKQPGPAARLLRALHASRRPGGNYGAEMTGVEYRPFRWFWPVACPETPRGFSMKSCPETPHKLLCRPVNSPAPPTHHSLYNSDKLSRLATPSGLIERDSTYGIRSLAEDRTPGAHFAGVIGGPP